MTFQQRNKFFVPDKNDFGCDNFDFVRDKSHFIQAEGQGNSHSVKYLQVKGILLKE